MEEAIEPAKSMFERAFGRFKSTIEAFPDDKLEWSPSATSRNAIQQAAHIGVSNMGMAEALKGNARTFASFEELLSEGRKVEDGYTTIAQVKELLETSKAAVISALEEITAARFGDSVDLGFNQMPLMAFVHFPGYHTANHAAQLDYMQTIYGNMVDHW